MGGEILAYLRSLDERGFGASISFALFGGPHLCGYKTQRTVDRRPSISRCRSTFSRSTIRRAPADVDLREPASEQGVFDVAGGHPWILTRLLNYLWDDPHLPAAVDEVYREAHMHFDVWKGQMGEPGVSLLQALPPAGVNRANFITDPNWKPYRMAKEQALSMCLINQAEKDDVVLPRPTLFRDWLGEENGGHQYDLAISYASEDSELARSIWTQLTGKYTRKERTYRVFFAEEAPTIWGERLDEVLAPIYKVKSRFVLVISSPQYVKKYLDEARAGRGTQRRGRSRRYWSWTLGTCPPRFLRN